MMNIFSIGNSIRSRIATVLTPRFSRLDSLSIVSRQSDLRTYSAESSCETFSVGQSSPLAFPFKAKSQLAFSHQSVLPILLLFLSLFMGVGNAWGVDPTETVTISTIASANSWTNGNHYSGWTSSSGKFTFTAANTGQGLYYSSDNSWRGYNSKGAMVITAGSGITIKSVSSSPSKTWTVNGSSAGNNASFTPTATTKFTSFTITYTETASKTLSSISITTQPNTRKYLVGETFSKTGAVVRATYSDASTADVSSSATWTPSGALTAGTSKTMTASYTESGTTKTATTTVDVYTVTVQKQDETGATITADGVSASASGRTLTASATAASHYVFRRWKYGTAAGTSIASSGSASTTLNGTPTGNVTVIAEFYKPIPVAWNTNGNLYETTYTGYNQKPVFPDNPSSCDETSDTFYGWATSTWDNTVDNLTGKTVYTSADGMSNVTAAGTTYHAVFAKQTVGSETSITGGNFNDDIVSGWSKSGTGTYSGNGVKFDNALDYIQTNNISSYGCTAVTVKFKAGHNGGSGSVLTFQSLDASSNVIDSKTFTPTQAYTSQTTVNTINLSGSKTIKFVRITMSSKTNNLGMKYCEIFYTPVTNSKYLTTCCTPLGQINGADKVSRFLLSSYHYVKGRFNRF